MDHEAMRQMIREEIKNVMSEGDYDKEVEMESEEYAGTEHMDYDDEYESGMDYEKDGDMEYSKDTGHDYENEKSIKPISSTTIEIIPIGSKKKKKSKNPYAE